MKKVTHLRLNISLIVILLIFLSITTKSQITLIPNPSPVDSGYMAYPIIFNGNLYFQYCNSAKKFQLAKYDGNIVSLIPNPSSFDLGMTGQAVLYNNNLYFTYLDSNGINLLAEYNDTTLSLIPNVNITDYGISGIPFVFNNNLYFPYKNAYSKYQLAVFNGNNISLINNPNTSDYGCLWSPIIYNNKLYFGYRAPSNILGSLANYDGINLNIIANPDNYQFNGFENNLTVYNQALYFNYYQYDSTYWPLWGYRRLAKYDGNSISLLEYADYGFYSPFQFNNNLLIGNSEDGGYNALTYSVNCLEKMDSNYNFSSVGNTCFNHGTGTGSGYVGCNIIFNDNMYSIINDQNSYIVAYYDTITKLQNPDSSITGFFGTPVIYNNKLFYCYTDINNKNVLTKYDGTTFMKVPNPLSSDVGVSGNLIVCNNAIYLKYLNSSNKYQLGRYIEDTVTVIAGVIKPLEKNLLIYPNPVKVNLTLETNLNNTEKLEIVNLLGETIYTSFINNKKVTINTSNFQSGVYFLRLVTDNGTIIRKFVKE